MFDDKCFYFFKLGIYSFSSWIHFVGNVDKYMHDSD